MIEHLSGLVLARLPHSIVLDVNGVGYGIEMPLSSLCEVPLQGRPLSLWIETYVREDALKLYGFKTFEDRQVFGMLRGVSGIGPKMALAIISTLDAKALRQTILSNRVEVLEAVPGIGKRTAEKLILELRPKMEKFSFASPSLAQGRTSLPRRSKDELQSFDEIEANQSALENLGYKDREIIPVITSVRAEIDSETSVDFSMILKSALRTLRSSL
ncbi:MAG: Holliday junction branch migration protein RuvA [Proteobacteria bacterium]|nr:Holliday junction branch migration protein RuvA [Pseudomonadota bacterium]